VALDVTEVTQSLTEGLDQVGASGPVGRQVTYSSGPCRPAAPRPQAAQE
jgi:hypothetical protein